ncbi:hypothetical protein AB4Y64_17670 [Lysobacter sp. TAF61]|uniref:hypothetical protein n=1 Tax=Lysobacter sp. TAF61 TaxID=3233072 RepID=UPI003F99C671
MTEQWLLVAFAIAFAATFWYLGECMVFFHRLETKHRTQWEAMGRPSIWDARSFGPYLKILLGLTPLGPDMAGCTRQLRRIRALLAVGLSAYLVVSLYQATHAG